MRQNSFGLKRWRPVSLLAVDVFPVPVTAVDPQGSLIHTTAVAADIGTPSDRDLLTIELDDHQTVSLVVEPEAGLRPSVELLGPDATVLAAVTADTAGQAAIVQTIPPMARESIRSPSPVPRGPPAITRFGWSSMRRSNSEPYTGVTTASLATAEDLSGSFIAIGPGADRGAVVGSLASLAVTDLGPGVNTADNDQDPESQCRRVDALLQFRPPRRHGRYRYLHGYAHDDRRRPSARRRT